MKGFHRLPSDVARRRDLSANAKIGFAYLTSRSRLGLQWPTLAEVEDDLGVTRKTAVRLLRELAEAGLASKRAAEIVLGCGGESTPLDGGETPPITGGESTPAPVEKLHSVGGETPPVAVEKLHSAPFYTENSDHSEREQIARAPASGLLLFESEVRKATGVGPDIGALREWWRRTCDEWTAKSGRPLEELDADVRAFGAWLARMPEAKRSGVVPHLRFRDHLGQWAKRGRSGGVARARAHTEFVADDVDAVFAGGE